MCCCVYLTYHEPCVGFFPFYSISSLSSSLLPIQCARSPKICKVNKVFGALAKKKEEKQVRNMKKCELCKILECKHYRLISHIHNIVEMAVMSSSFSLA